MEQRTRGWTSSIPWVGRSERRRGKEKGRRSRRADWCGYRRRKFS
jgi:hypothetical protein